MSALTNFLGGSPLAVLIKLLIVSLIVGVVMSTFGWSPYDVLDWARDAVRSVWNMGFGALGDAGRYIMLGGAIVVPIFIILRLFSMRRR